MVLGKFVENACDLSDFTCVQRSSCEIQRNSLRFLRNQINFAIIFIESIRNRLFFSKIRKNSV